MPGYISQFNSHKNILQTYVSAHLLLISQHFRSYYQLFYTTAVRALMTGHTMFCKSFHIN